VENARQIWRGRLYRWRWWLAALAVLITVRAVLPLVLRKVLVDQASQALRARVEVGDVDLALLRGGIALEDVAVRAGPAQPSTEPGHPSTDSGRTEEPAPASAAHTPSPVRPELVEGRPPTAPPAFGDDAPLVAFKRFAVELRFLPLFSKTIQLRDIELESPRVALDRLASGDLNLLALVPQSDVAVEAGATPGVTPGAESTPPGTPATDEGATPWGFGLDRFVLRDGRLRFRDLALEGSEPVEVGIDEIAVNEIALSPSVYGQPARVHVKLGVDTGEIDVDARVQINGAAVAVTTDVHADRLPLRRARLYVPTVGWSALKGELDLALTYELETEKTNRISGTFGLRDVGVSVPQLEDVAVAWKSLAVDIETVDLLAQRAAVRSVELNGATMYVRATGDEPLPVLAPGAAHPAPAAPAATPAAPADTPADEPAAKPWDWSVAQLHIGESTVRILSDQPPLDIGVELTASQLAGAPEAIAHVAVGLAVASGGRVDVDGNLRIAPPAFGGTLKIAELALPPLAAVSGQVAPSVLPSGMLKADLAIDAGLPSAAGGSAATDRLRVAGSLGLAGVQASPPGQEALGIAAAAVDLTIHALEVPGVIPIGQPAAAGATLDGKLDLQVQDLRVARTGEAPLASGVQTIALAVPSFSLPASLAGLAPPDGAPPIRASATLELTAPQLAMADGKDLTAAAGSIGIDVTDAVVTVVPTGGSAAGAPPATLGAEVRLTGATFALAEGKQLNGSVQSVLLKAPQLNLPGLVVGAPPADTGEPLRAVADLEVTQLKAARADGKEFSAAAQSIRVPLTELLLPGLFAAPGTVATAPTRVTLGEVGIESPALRVTRTKQGIVLPIAEAPPGAAAAAPAPTPAAAPATAAKAPGVELAMDALRLTRGGLDFTDRAVQPVFQARYAPIEIDARQVRFPALSVKPLRVEISTAEQGTLTLRGELAPAGGAMTLELVDFSLLPFNPYTATYSPYSLSSGALTLKTTAKYKGGNYDVANDITLHQLDLAGAEGDALFEQQFGISLGMALALLRDMNGDIDLDIPVEVDQAGGAKVDVLAVVRGALRQALMGAIQSPLKMLGAVGGGGAGASLAPAPIAFRTGRADLTPAGGENVDRLAGFLASRPGMGVQLQSNVTAQDVRWLREQGLAAEWEQEGFFAKLGSLTQRGARDRIRAAIAARADDEVGELSAEDAALLQTWLDERPPPSAEQVRRLGAARLAAVTAVLADKGIPAARITSAEPGGEPAEGAAVVSIKFEAAARAAAPAS